MLCVVAHNDVYLRNYNVESLLLLFVVVVVVVIDVVKVVDVVRCC